MCETLAKSLHQTDFAISVGNRSGGGMDCINAYAIVLGKLIKSEFKPTNKKRISPDRFFKK